MSYTLERWTMPDNYFGAEWPQYFVFIGRNRDSDDMTESNFAVALERLGGESETVQVIRESHWACGWIEWIAIHESDATALENARDMIESLNDYPALDEEDWSRRESESAYQIWRDCYDVPERIEYIRKHQYMFEFVNRADIINCVRGKYFPGYPSELLA